MMNIVHAGPPYPAKIEYQEAESLKRKAAPKGSGMSTSFAASGLGNKELNSFAEARNGSGVSIRKDSAPLFLFSAILPGKGESNG